MISCIIKFLIFGVILCIMEFLILTNAGYNYGFDEFQR